jgi:hypothetical protein
LSALSELVLRFSDAARRGAVAAALSGPGKPVGVQSCDERGDDLIILVDSDSTPLSLVRHLADIEARRFERPAVATDGGSLSDDMLARIVAEAIAEPELDSGRILEVRVPELDERGGR